MKKNKLLLSLLLMSNLVLFSQADSQAVLLKLKGVTKDNIRQQECISHKFQRQNIYFPSDKYSVAKVNTSKELVDVLVPVYGGCDLFERESKGNILNDREDGIVYLIRYGSIMTKEYGIIMKTTDLPLMKDVKINEFEVRSFKVGFGSDTRVYSTLDDALESGELKTLLSDSNKNQDLISIEEIDIIKHNSTGYFIPDGQKYTY